MVNFGHSRSKFFWNFSKIVNFFPFLVPPEYWLPLAKFGGYTTIYKQVTAIFVQKTQNLQKNFSLLEPIFQTFTWSTSMKFWVKQLWVWWIMWVKFGIFFETSRLKNPILYQKSEISKFWKNSKLNFSKICKHSNFPFCMMVHPWPKIIHAKNFNAHITHWA